MAEVTTEQVWDVVQRQMFAVVGMVSARGQARTAGIVYTVHDRRLFFITGEDAWKTRHVRAHPQVSVTVTVPKRVPLMPWIAIPPAVVTFSGTAQVLPAQEAPESVRSALLRGLELGEGGKNAGVAIEIVPEGDFVTYGIGVPLRQLRDTELARGRAPVALAPSPPPPA